MKYSILSLLFIAYIGGAFSQTDSIDLAIQNLSGTEQVDKMNQLSFSIAQSDPERAISLAQDAAHQAKELDYNYGIGDALHKLSVVYRFQGLYDKSLLYADSALTTIGDQEARSLRAAINSNKGVCYRYKGEYENALLSYQKAIDLHRADNQMSDVATVLNNLGVMFMYMEDYEKAIDYYDQAMEIQVREKNKKEISNIYNNYAIVYANQGVLDSSLLYFEKSYEIEKELNNLQGMSESINNIGAVYYYMGDIDRAIEQFRASYEIDSTLGDVRGQISTLSNIAEMLNESGEPKEAIKILEQSLTMAREIDSKYDIQTSLANLSSAYRNLGDYENAFLYYVQYSEVHDSVLGLNQQEIVQELETKYQTEQKEQTIRIQELELEEANLSIRARNNMLLGLAGVLILAIFSSIMGYRFIQSKREAELQRAVAFEQEKQLEAVINATEQEKRRIAKELHDGIGQQLSSIKLGLSNIFQQLREKAPETIEKINLVEKVVDESARDVRELSHQMMPKSLQELGLGPALNDLVNKSLGLTEIAFNYHDGTEGERFDSRIEVNLYRVSQELINNILKHSKAKRVSLELFKENKYLTLAVKDDGIGFDPEKDEGHGMLNIKSRLKQINARLNFEFPSEGGTETTIIVQV